MKGGAIFEKFKRCRAYEIALELKAEGKIRHFGISFHDKAPVLERILTEYPQVEVVQIQLNYLDYEDATVESRKVYEVCERFHKPVLVMEPVKGGSLARLPEGAQFHDWNQDYYYHNILTRDAGKASECIRCGKCEKICPQHLSIRELLKDVAREFEHGA